ncbi:hypothetical protein QZH41_003432 [Actinostola sp. cb2023]|nr:hypothetical protein QZH41_003432 [Actinostola sp. cb2023]
MSVQQEQASFVIETCDTGATNKRKRANISEREKQFIVECYNHCMGKDWKDVVLFSKSKIVDSGLPQRVMQFYFESKEKQLVTRMKSIIKQALQPSAQSDPKPQSKPIEVEGTGLVKAQMKYAKKKTPKERRRDALKNKIECDFVGSSDPDESEQELARSPKKSKKKKAAEAQDAHKKMCEKAIETMDRA